MADRICPSLRVAREFSHNEVDLSVYGPAESLIGKFAVEVEDARREP